MSGVLYQEVARFEFSGDGNCFLVAGEWNALDFERAVLFLFL
jgi:hypothetical protein